MDKFSERIIDELTNRKISIPCFAEKIKLSATYTYNLLNGTKRWNADSMGRACEALGLEVEFKKVKGVC